MDSLLRDLNAERFTKTEVNQKQQKEYKLVGKEKKVPGHTLFSFNKKSKEIKVAEIDRQVLMGFNRKPVYCNKILVEEDCIYVQALNKKNALKILKRNNLI